MITRREALKTAATFALVGSPLLAAENTPAPTTATPAAPAGPFKLPALGYSFDALEPFIDAKTMEIHHDKHHNTYVTNLNKALADYPDLQSKSVEDLLKNLDAVPEKIRAAVKNNAGGHYNHTLFWQCLKKGDPRAPQGKLREAFGELYQSDEEGQKDFLAKALGVFGSGWIWIVLDKEKSLKVVTTSNQDCPLSQGMTPLAGLDLWEHAYYLKYQNRRKDYVEAINNVLNWDFIEERYERLAS
jgi:Fe-Mn family superoxide dismutase